MKQFIQKHPYWYYSLLTGVFIYIFLMVFQPFGFGKIPWNIMNPLFLGYALIGFLMVFFNHILLGSCIQKKFPDKASLARIWLWPLWITLTIVLANVGYTRWYFIETGLSNPAYFQAGPVIIGTLALGTLCIFVIEMIDQNIRLRQNLRTQELANQKLTEQLPRKEPAPGGEETMEIKAQNDKESYRFSLESLLYLNARENYVAVHFKKEKCERTLIRNTISDIQDQLKKLHPLIFRCHRGYMVNIRKIRSVTGNAQGFKLSLEGVSEPIPVSRRYVPDFREIVRKHL
jgi:hypothetical protein